MVGEGVCACMCVCLCVCRERKRERERERERGREGGRKGEEWIGTQFEEERSKAQLKKSLQIFCLGQVFLGCVLVLTVLPSAVTSWRKPGADIFATF